MAEMTDKMIAHAIAHYLEQQIVHSVQGRKFFQLSGFSNETYRELLTHFDSQEVALGGTKLEVRTIEKISGFEHHAREENYSPTWYRNHVPNGHALVLIFNRRTSDAQSLKDIFPVTEATLSRNGLNSLIHAALTDYQINAEERKLLTGFIRRLGRVIAEAQLRDIVDFLLAVNAHLRDHRGDRLEVAIATQLPYLGLFRCQEFADIVNSRRANNLLEQIARAVQIGIEVLDDESREEFLTRLETADLVDDSAFGGSTIAEKRDRLRQFIREQVTDRDQLLDVLRIEWEEVKQALYKKARKAKANNYSEIAAEIETTLKAEQVEGEQIPVFYQELLDDLKAERDPESEAIDTILREFGESFGKTLINRLRKLVKIRVRTHSDFLVGLTAVAVELLHPMQSELQPGTRLRVQPQIESKQRRKTNEVEAEAVLTFRALYGGIEHTFTAIDWHLDALWSAADAAAAALDIADEVDDIDQPDQVARYEMSFRISIINAGEDELANAELRWQYRSDSPAAATYRHLMAEQAQMKSDGTLFQASEHKLRIPIYNHSTMAHDIGDLDLRRPLQTLGAWYERTTDLRENLAAAVQRTMRPEHWQRIEDTLRDLERVWGAFIATTTSHGIFAADIDALLGAYETLLGVSVAELRGSRAATAGFRIINQAWIVGAATFESWAIVPLLHPLKLFWWRERARHFNAVITHLLDPAASVAIVDEPRYRKELAVTYGSANFPPVLALPMRDGIVNIFLPIDEAEGYELYCRESVGVEAYGLDTDLLTADENEIAAQRAVDGLAAVIQDYIETYPFVRDGIEIYLLECRNGALPGMLIDRLIKTAERRHWTLRLTVIVHTTDRGAPLFQRVSTWVASERTQTQRSGQEYFPPITAKVLECSYEELFQRVEDTDIVILADVLSDQGQEVRAEIATDRLEDLPLDGYLPVYRARQEPFERYERYRRILLNPIQQPRLVRHFLASQYAAAERRGIPVDAQALFYRELSLERWEQTLIRLHALFNWVVCYDMTIDRFLMEEAFQDQIQVIRYSLGLGVKRQHNLTVSSSRRAQDIVIARLTSQLQHLIKADENYRAEIAQQLVNEAKQVSGDIVLRAAGPGAFLNELIGMVATKFLTERHFLAEHPNALCTWILLDDFEHWFTGKFPDLLFVAILPEQASDLHIHVQVIETKCIGHNNFALEAADAQRQVINGVNRLAQALSPGAAHLDALYWYDQFYRAFIGNLRLDQPEDERWQRFRDKFHVGVFTFSMIGHSWVFCYDGQAGLSDGVDEGDFVNHAPDAPEVPLHYHHYGRNELRLTLRDLIEKGKDLSAIRSDAWSLSDSGAIEEAESDKLTTMAENIVSLGEMDLAEAETSSEQEVIETLSDNRSQQKTMSDDTEQSPKNSLRSAVQRRVEALSNEEASDHVVADEVITAERRKADERAWVERKASELQRALQQRSINIARINPEEADIGPSIVRFKIRLRPGEQLRRLQKIDVDLARDLALSGTPLIDNVLSTNYVGIDLPREHRDMIDLLPLLDQLPNAEPAELPVVIGVTPDGQTIFEDLAEFPHLLVAGATNSGKSVFLRSLLLNLMTSYRPHQIQLLIIDPKRTDFTFFNHLPYLRGGRVIVDRNEARDALLDLVHNEMRRRQDLIANRAFKVKDFNERFPNEALPPIVALIDEYALLVSMMEKKERDAFEQDLMILAAAARSVGIHLVLATQRPSADIVTSTLKANLDARIAFRVASSTNSRVVLDQAGAENLLGRGDMLFRRPSGELARLQAPFTDAVKMQAYLQRLSSDDEQ